jgi:hypothetical protein
MAGLLFLFLSDREIIYFISNIEVIMRFFNYMAIFAFLISYTALPQGMARKYPVKENLSGSYPIDGSHLLWKQDQEVAKWVKEHPDYLNKTRLSKAASWGFSVGSTHQWNAYNFSTDSYYSVSSTCRGIGEHCYVFVEDADWGGTVNQAAVDSVVNEFENKTPASSSKGIYQTDVDSFGDPPNVDGDSKIVILILNIQDGYSGSGGYTAGYFSSGNEMPKASFSYSNVAEIYYMDCNPTDLTTTDGLNTALETCAHEFQHMINWNYHQSNTELTFINEGCSMAAEIICGYSAFYPGLYATETNHYLLDWRSSDATAVLNDYSRAQRYFIYWLDQFGVGIFKDIVQDSHVGLDGLENALTTDGQSVSFTQSFINWLIANKLDDTSINPAYGYSTYTGLTKAESKSTNYNPNISSTDTVKNLAAEYVTFTNGSNLNITFSTSSTDNLVVKAIEEGSGASQVVDVPLNSTFSIPEYGSTYTTIHFAIINTSTSGAKTITYTATGTASTAETELKWDVTEPTGYYSWTTSDTICVAFDAVAGGKLDSIKVALRRAGSIAGGVWNYTGSTTLPLGKKLASITASISTTASIINSGATYPYTTPYDNWATVNLTSDNISTDNAFAVGFVIGSDPKTPGVMITDYASTDAYHSYTYMQTGDGVTTPGWYYLTSSDTTVAIYLIRAYVSLVSSDVKQKVELTPASFSLYQNYPNPFNPSTIINFSVPKAGRVRISVYNQLGQQVALIADGDYSSGNHSINFSGASLASGIYYYRIVSGSLTQTKKMVLLK